MSCNFMGCFEGSGGNTRIVGLEYTSHDLHLRVSIPIYDYYTLDMTHVNGVML